MEFYAPICYAKKLLSLGWKPLTPGTYIKTSADQPELHCTFSFYDDGFQFTKICNKTPVHSQKIEGYSPKAERQFDRLLYGTSETFLRRELRSIFLRRERTARQRNLEKRLN